MGKKRSALAVWVMAGLFSLGFSGGSGYGGDGDRDYGRDG